MAEAIFRHKVSQRPDADQWQLGSAGTRAARGYPATPAVPLVLEELGIPFDDHESQPVEKALLGQFNLTLTMESSQLRMLHELDPTHSPRIKLVSEMVGEIFDIPDPYGSDLRMYRILARQLLDLLHHGMDSIERLSGP
jgi:protein-tyrosine-phosphatase